jgi:O-antigen/teichoic acid export membrane protein
VGGLRRLFRHVLVYGAGRLGVQLFSLVTLPILSRIFTPADYGVIEALTTYVSVVAIVATLALESAVQRSYFDYPPEEPERRRVVLGTALAAMLSWSTLVTLVLVAVSRPTSQLMFGTHRYALLVALAVAALPLTVASNFFQEILRLRHQAGRYVLVGFVGTALTVALVLYLTAVRDIGLKGFYLGALLAAPVTVALAYVLVRGAFRVSIDRRELGVMLAYGLPLLPVAAMTWIMQLGDRLFVLHFASAHELGLYAVGVRLSNVLLFAVVAFGVAWSPFILELYSRDVDEERRMRVQALRYVVLGLAFGAVCVSVLAREFFLVVTASSFEQAYRVVGLLSLSVVALGINGVTMTGISLARRTRYFALYTVYCAVLNIVLNFALIPPFGIVGAALATLVTYAALATLYYRRAQLLDRVPFDRRQLLVVVALASALIGAGTAINLEPVWLSVLAKIPLIVAFPLLAWLLGCVDPRLTSRVSAPVLKLLQQRTT